MNTRQRRDRDHRAGRHAFPDPDCFGCASEACGAESVGFVCTLRTGHEGNHRDLTHPHLQPSWPAIPKGWHVGASGALIRDEAHPFSAEAIARREGVLA